jgi:hypothetical protein
MDFISLNFSNKTLVANSIEEDKLWHWRMGHASDVVLNKLLSLRHLDNSNCDIYYYFLKKN